MKKAVTVILLSLLLLVPAGCSTGSIGVGTGDSPLIRHAVRTEYEGTLQSYVPFVDGFGRDAWVLTFTDGFVIVVRTYQLPVPVVGHKYSVSYHTLSSDDYTKITER